MFSLSSDNAPTTGNYLDPHSPLADDLQEFIRQDIDLETRPEAVGGESLWQGLREQGSELWLDTGDIQAIEALWSDHFSGLTTNNSLLNDQVQSGVYDDLIVQADRMLQELPLSQRVREIAFVLNARHGLRLVQRFGCRVSVELHTDFAFDCPATIANARRLHDICPDKFVVKVPFTPPGIIATGVLRQEEIPASEDKIPRHTHWHEKMMQGELAIDSLLTLAGLVHFARSQQALDERIERGIAEG